MNNNLLSSNKLICLTEDNMPILQQVTKYEKIQMPDELATASAFYVFNDTILVALYINPDPYWVSIMNIKNKRILAQYFKKGNGPKDFLLCYANMRNNKLLLKDGYLRKIAIVDLDSVVSQEQLYKPSIYYLNSEDYSSFDVLTDTSFVFYNYWYLENGGEVVNCGVPELVVTGKDANYSYEPPQNAIIVNNVNGAYIFSNKEQEKVFIAYRHKPQFTLLNSNLDTIKVICGPEPIEKYKYEDKGSVNGGLKPILYNEYSMRGTITDNYIILGNARMYIMFHTKKLKK